MLVKLALNGQQLITYGFQKWLVRFVGFQNLLLRVRVWVRVQGSKFLQKTGFWVQVWVGFCKKTSKYQRNSFRKIIFLIY
jgi:hypothetical protein